MENDMANPIRVLLCGTGNRAFPKNPEGSNFAGWVEMIQKSTCADLVAAQDIEGKNLQRIESSGILHSDQLFTDLDEALENVPCDAVLVCPIVEAHADCIRRALKSGRHVLVEKPLVSRLSDAVALARQAKQRGLTVGVVQNWRGKSVGQALREAISDRQIGRVGNIFFRYVRNREYIHLPSYLFKEPYPLLYALGIHHLDLFRYILGENIVSVSGTGFRPPWTGYSSYPGVALNMVTESGVHISYAGTFSSKGRHTALENLLIDGEFGTLTNESDWGDPPLMLSTTDSPEAQDLTADVTARDIRSQYDLSDTHILQDFCDSIRLGRPPLCPIEDNLWTLAALEASVEACETEGEVQVSNVLARAGLNGGV